MDIRIATADTQFITPSDNQLVMTRTFDAPRQIVFDAWTKPEHLRHWALGRDGWTMPVCENDLRPGGAWRFVWRDASGQEMEMRGAYREVKPAERIVSTESWGGHWPDTLNTTTFSERDGKTTVRQAILYPSKDARDAAIATGIHEGASQSFNRLDEYLRQLI